MKFVYCYLVLVRMYIPRKRERYGVNIYILCETPTEYLSNFKFYTAVDTSHEELTITLRKFVWWLLKPLQSCSFPNEWPIWKWFNSCRQPVHNSWDFQRIVSGPNRLCGYSKKKEGCSRWFLVLEASESNAYWG